MKKHKMSFLAVLVTAGLMAQNAFAVSQVLSWNQVTAAGDGSPTGYSAVVIDSDDTIYSNLANGSSGQIVKTTWSGGTPTTTSLLSNSAWYAASGTTNLTTYYGLSITGNYLQFYDVGTDSIWRVDKTNGNISEYLSEAAIATHMGVSIATNVNIYSPCDTHPSNGEFYFYMKERYNETNRAILKTNGSGQVQTYMSASDIDTATGISGATVSGGLTFDDNYNMIWASNDSKEIYSFNGSSNTTLLDTSDLNSILNSGDIASFGDIFYAAEEDLVYFKAREKDASDNLYDAILSFDPDDPDNSLSYVLTSANLDYYTGHDSVGQLVWYYDEEAIAWNQLSTLSPKGLFVNAPEPSTIVLLLLGLAAVVIRRIKR